MKRELKREQTLQLLLNTTREIVMEKGCTRTTLSEIMKRSGLSKGAIFHYVKSKDELLALVLHSSTEETDRRFNETIENGDRSFEGPMNVIASNLAQLMRANDPSNDIFRYMIGRSEEPFVQELLSNYYARTVTASAQWIERGQSEGVIPSSVDARVTAELFVLLALGARVRSGLPSLGESAIAPQDFGRLMTNTLQIPTK